ncbi:GDSL-type esterase/lipase family protein [Leucothrix arctica]|uniref:GDSL family lipase n=1 Tax=Leucothrix arctica TaxID=1481894 RepID=A0A317CG60_9GAMM|nr:GDSL-type esterase/lipase family protein [Leucothrix arctica]PWQ97329.1 GDSL family lipase [Leucothrix arctica]
MTKFILIVWLIFIHAIAILAVLETDLAYRIDRKLGLGLITSKELTSFYTNMVGSQEQLDGSVKTGSVIFLGDSITQGLNVAAITHPAINYGIGMDTTYGLINRLPKYQSLSRASHIIVAIGINDLIRTHRNNDEILDNFSHIFKLLPVGIPVTVQAILPVDERVTTQGFNLRVDQINQALALLAKSHGARFLDMSHLLINDQGNLKTEYHVGDGLHLSTSAYQVWIDTLKPYFKVDVSLR